MVPIGARHQPIDLAQLIHTQNRILVMGVVNTTPDSFSDGGKFVSADAAVSHAMRLIEEGADLIDIGGESSRPGAEPVSEQEELRRVIPVVSALAKNCAAPISVDTCKAAVAKAALEAGAAIINDITALTGDAGMAAVISNFDAGVVLMHMRGTPKQMQNHTKYDNLIDEISSFLKKSILIAENAGIDSQKIIVDPGVGFGKDVEGNLTILRSVAKFSDLGKPVMIGASRKSFIGRLTGADAGNRLAGSLAAAVVAVINGANLVRVHDVKETRQAVDLTLHLREKQ